MHWQKCIHSIFAGCNGSPPFIYVCKKLLKRKCLIVVIILVLAAPSGLVLGYHANGGIVAQLGFMVLALLWFYFTYLAFLFARKKEWDKHRKFMFRRYALTLSPISHRVLKLGIVNVWELPPMDITRIIAWGGWMLNLISLEIVLKFLQKSKSVMKSEL